MARRLYLISHRDMRKNRADAVHIMRVCSEYSKNNFDVTLVTPRTLRFEYKKKLSEIWTIHKVPKTFKVIELPVFLFDNMPKFFLFYSRFMRFVNYGIYFLFLLITGKLKKGDVIYISDYTSSLPAILLKKIKLLKCGIFLDKSEIINDGIRRIVAKNADGIVSINGYIKDTIAKLYSINPEKIFKRPFPSMSEELLVFNEKDKNYYRELLNIPVEDKIAVYSGKISPDLIEIDMILQAAEILKDSGIKFYFIGIREINKQFYADYLKKRDINNVTFIDFQPVESFIKYVKIADVLVSYYDGNDFFSCYLRVPAKSSLYLSSDIPSIFADVHCLREWFTDEMVYFVKPNNPKLLAEKIKYVIEHPDDARKKAEASLKFAKESDYSRAYREVCEFINTFNKN